MKEAVKTLNVPSAIVLATTIVSFVIGIVMALIFVSDHTWNILGHALASTPWPVVFAVGTPLLVSAISAIRQSWHGPVIEKTDDDPKPPA